MCLRNANCWSACTLLGSADSNIKRCKVPFCLAELSRAAGWGSNEIEDAGTVANGREMAENIAVHVLYMTSKCMKQPYFHLSTANLQIFAEHASWSRREVCFIHTLTLLIFESSGCPRIERWQNDASAVPVAILKQKNRQLVTNRKKRISSKNDSSIRSRREMCLHTNTSVLLIFEFSWNITKDRSHKPKKENLVQKRFLHSVSTGDVFTY